MLALDIIKPFHPRVFGTQVLARGKMFTSSKMSEHQLMAGEVLLASE